MYNLRKIIKFNWSVAVAIMKLAAAAATIKRSLYAGRALTNKQPNHATSLGQQQQQQQQK